MRQAAHPHDLHDMPPRTNGPFLRVSTPVTACHEHPLTLCLEGGATTVPARQISFHFASSSLPPSPTCFFIPHFSELHVSTAGLPPASRAQRCQLTRRKSFSSTASGSRSSPLHSLCQCRSQRWWGVGWARLVRWRPGQRPVRGSLGMSLSSTNRPCTFVPLTPYCPSLALCPTLPTPPCPSFPLTLRIPITHPTPASPLL